MTSSPRLGVRLMRRVKEIHVTDDRDFKRVVRARAAETGERYSTVREQLAAEQHTAGKTTAVATAYDALLERLRTAYFGDDEMLQQFLVATLAGGDVLLEAASGVGRSSLVAAFAAAVGATPTAIDGCADPDIDDVTRATEVVLVTDIEQTSARFRSGLRDLMITKQRLVFVSHLPGADLARLGGDLFDGFIASFPLPMPSRDAEEQILRVARSGLPWVGEPPLLEWAAFRGLAAACGAVAVPDEVSAHVLDVVGALRAAAAGPGRISPRGSISLAKLAAAAAAVGGRSTATVADVDRMVGAALRHRAGVTPAA